MAGHTHTRGTMNITGKAVPNQTYVCASLWTDADLTGAFYSDGVNVGGYIAKTGGNAWRGLSFDASRSWTGATSSVGNNTAHNNLMPYKVIYMYRRIS